MKVELSEALMRYMEENHAKDIVLEAFQRACWGGGSSLELGARFASVDEVEQYEKENVQALESPMGKVYISSSKIQISEHPRLDLSKFLWMKIISISGIYV